VDGSRQAFIVFGLAATKVGTHIGFALDRIRGEVTHVRVLRLTPGHVEGRDIDVLEPCGDRRSESPQQPAGILQPWDALVTI